MYKYKPSKAQREEFARKMSEIEQFCFDNKISQSLHGDSYYFCLNGVGYRVSNHSVEASDRAAYDDYGEKKRELYHGGRDADTVYIHASKTRIIEIYEAIKCGKKLDGRGNVLC